MKKVLVAGATGYLGKYLTKELKKQGYQTVALARNISKVNEEDADEIIKAEVTDPKTLEGICDQIDCVISVVGITRQKDGLTYMDVDYQANVNLLNEALKSKAKKFIYVSALNGQHLRHLKIAQAKERFADKLKASGIAYTIFRPNGFFSDMLEVLEMARRGTVYLFGNGAYRGNPIHGADLAAFIVNNLESDEIEIDVGGPDLLTQDQIARTAFKAAGKQEKIVHLPLWIRDLALWTVRTFTGQKTYGPIEFFLTVMTMDMIAPKTGHHHLSQFYMETQNLSK
jgi:uncharacterized protein YbjT (DUF2867 family)